MGVRAFVVAGVWRDTLRKVESEMTPFIRMGSEVAPIVLILWVGNI